MENNQQNMYLEISRGKRVAAVLINALITWLIGLTGLLKMFDVFTKTHSQNILWMENNHFVFDKNLLFNLIPTILSFLVISLIPTVINILLLLVKSTTIAGLILGYKYVDKDSKENLSLSKLILLGLCQFLNQICYSITLGIFWIVDVTTLQKRNGTYAEKWANVVKTSTK